MEIKCTFSDFESSKISNTMSLVHTITLIPAILKTGKTCQYTKFPERMLTIKIIDVLYNENMKAFMLTRKNKFAEKTEGEHLEAKHENDKVLCDLYGVIIRRMRFFPAIKKMNKFIIENGGILLGHNIIEDFKHLVCTQNVVKGPRIIKNKLGAYPVSGMYDPVWKNIITIDTMSILSNRCPKFNVEYISWCKQNESFLEKGMQSLERYMQFLKNDKWYKLSHSAVQDTLNLFEVIKYAYKCDGPIIDGTSYIAKPNYINPPKNIDAV